MTWEELQTAFRKTEGKLYSGLSEFNQFAVRLSKASNDITVSSTGADTAQQDAGYWQSEFERRHNNLTSLQQHITEIIARLKHKASQQPASDIQNSFLRRADTVHAEVQRECARNVQACNVSLVRLRLFQGARSPDTSGAQALQREQQGLVSSLGAVDEQIAMAHASKASLLRQRDTVSGSLDKLRMLGEKFPQIGRVMGAISRYQQRDTVVLALVIATCMPLGDSASPSWRIWVSQGMTTGPPTASPASPSPM